MRVQDLVANACNLSVSRLAHLFRAQVGLSPMQFLERERLERAKSLLELTPRQVGEIAREVGFEDAFHFSKRFRRWTGSSPRAFRQQS
jgi:AraC family transcriptional regulator, arabinose operon regulatory protein